MKKLSLIVSFVLFAALAALPCAAQQGYTFNLPANDEPIYGAWVNTDYSGLGSVNSQKRVYLSWGFGMLYSMVTDEVPSYELTFILVEKWINAGGATLYNMFLQGEQGKEYFLARVSADRNTLERVRGAGFPKESSLLPTNTPPYRFYRRWPPAMSSAGAWKKIVGEWVNTEYTGSQPYTQKTVIRPDFRGEYWDKVTDTTPSGVWQ